MRPQIKVQELQEYFDRHMYGFNASIFAHAWNNKQHVLLSGPGGHGKSESAQLFYRFLVEKGIYPQESSAFVQSFNPETTTEKIFGGTNIKEFTEKGRIVFNYNDSFLVHRFVIIEEILDATAAPLMALKDTLTSGYHRDGSTVQKVECDIIIGCTNMSPEEFAENHSTQAFLERFTYQMEVKWGSYIEDDYIKAFEKAEKRSATVIARAVANAAAASYKPQEGGRPVSPRTYMRAVKSCENCTGNPLEPLFFMNYPGGFRHDAVKIALTNLNALLKDQEDDDKIEAYRKNLTSLASEFATVYAMYNSNPSDDKLGMDLYNIVKLLFEVYSEVNGLNVRDTSSAKHKQLLMNCKQAFRKMAETLKSTIPDDTSNQVLSNLKNTAIEKHEW